MPCTFSTWKHAPAAGEYFIIYSYKTEDAAIYAGESAIEALNLLIGNRETDLSHYHDEINYLARKSGLGATTAYILGEVKRRKIPYRRVDESSIFILGHGKHQKKIRTAVTDSTSGLGMEMASDKDETKEILALANIPVPEGILVYSAEELEKRIGELKFPLVVKPLDGNHGRGVTTDIRTKEQALFGFSNAQKISRAVMVEEYIGGNDYRFLIINYQLVAATMRKPAHVTGDGVSSIKMLIDKENLNPLRGRGQDQVLAAMVVDGVTEKILAEKNYTPDTVLKKGETCNLKYTANISAGGTAEDVTDLVHPENKFMAERIARLFNLDICGVDIVTTSVEEPITRATGAVIEVNAGPGLRMHSNPQKGKARNVATPIVEMLFPPNAPIKIPIVAVTGTNGKTTVTRLIAFIVKQAGFKPGYTTTEGIYIDGHRTYSGDCTGYKSSEDVLFEPEVDFAVLECARGGILRSGLAFSECEIGIVTNVSEDHLGLKDINTLEDMARVKMVIPLAVKEDGYAILNADDDLVYAMRDDVKCKVALFSETGRTERITMHCEKGAAAAYLENGDLLVCRNGSVINFGRVSEIPLSMGGRADCMIKNLLPSVLTAVLLDIEHEKIVQALKDFTPSPAFTPGRMNIFDLGKYKVMIDYAHNIDGYRDLKKFMSKTESQNKVGIISIAGDRKDDDIRSVGSIAAEMFDEIIIRHDVDMRGRPKDELTRLLLEGIKSRNESKPVKVISSEEQAIEYAMEHAREGAFIVLASEKVDQSIELLTRVSESAVQK